MIKERYVSFEIAKMLKEKGMDKNYFTHYMQQNNDDGTSEAVTTCTHQMAMEWLREKYKLFLGVGFGNDDKGEFLYMVDIYDLTIEAVEGKYKPIVEADEYLEINPKTPEEAVEAAILYSLENLI